MDNLTVRTKQSTQNTSWHTDTIMASVSSMRKAIGEPTFDDNDGQEKTNYEWQRETVNGDVFCVYDWKVGRSLRDDEWVTWHIGAHNNIVSAQALLELRKAIKANQAAKPGYNEDGAEFIRRAIAEREDNDKLNKPTT